MVTINGTIGQLYAYVEKFGFGGGMTSAFRTGTDWSHYSLKEMYQKIVFPEITRIERAISAASEEFSNQGGAMVLTDYSYCYNTAWCVLRRKNGEVVVGTATCAKSDIDNKELGELLATARALDAANKYLDEVLLEEMVMEIL